MEREVYKRMELLEGEHWWFVARRRILADQLAALGLPANARILEVGCGSGGNLEMLSRFGQVSAMELDEEAREIAACRSGIRVEGGALPGNLPFAPGTFDLIAALDVIEHVEDDAAAVESLARLLKPSGVLLVTVPAYPWLWSHHDASHHHKRRYVLNSVRALTEAAGLTVGKLCYFNTILFPLAVGGRLFKRLAGMSERPDDGMPGPLLNRLLAALFAVERHVLRRKNLPFGLSVLCIAGRGQQAELT